VIWSVAQTVGGQGILLLVYLALARLVSPGEFGLVGFATVWTAILAAFSELGFGAALIQRAEITAEHKSTTFAANLVAGGLLTAIGVALSWPIAVTLQEPRLRWVMASLSVGFLLRAPGLTHVALAQRDLRFRALALRDVGANLIAGILGVAMALNDLGVWSLVGVNLASAGIGTVLVWHVDRWRPSWRKVSLAALNDLWPYSSSILAFNVFKAFAQNMDRLIVGYLLGTVALGYYSLAARLVLQPIAMPIGALGVYLFPKVARVQEDPIAARESYARVLSVCLALATPYALVVWGLAPILVPIVLGSEWEPAVAIVSWMGVAALVRAVFSPATQMLKALGRPDLMLRWSIMVTVSTVLGLSAGAYWGLSGIAIGFAAAHALLLPVIVSMTAKLSGYSTVNHLLSARRALLGGAAATIVILAASAVWGSRSWAAASCAAALSLGLGAWLISAEAPTVSDLKGTLRTGY
jgi:O-antigen/teichoic acid export membrane protein